MSEEQEINKARELIANNNFNEASEILWKLYQSSNKKIKLDSILALLVVLDRFTENEKLLEIVDVGLNILLEFDARGTKTYLIAEKISMLLTKLGLITYRHKNLKLSANVFKWINFSTEKEKNEFDIIEKEKQKIKKEVANLEGIILNYINISNDHYVRGNIYSKIGDCYTQKSSSAKFDAIIGGKYRYKIANIYFLRRWNIDKWIVYDNNGRKKIKNYWEKCIYYYNMAIFEFSAGEKYIELAYTYYNIAVQYMVTFRFRKARKFLKKSFDLAKKYNEVQLLSKIELLKKRIVNKNRNIKNYVEEYGLDLP